MTTTFLRTPGQASHAFGLGTSGATRLKGAFFVRFRRPSIDAGEGTQFGFIVKTVDQPKITAKTEELSQYNKKRHIHTGYDVSPVTITLYDTAGGTARDLWRNYLAHHYGDFRHESATDWQSDQLSSELVSESLGYGIRVAENEFNDSHYYFHTIEIIQVHGGFFTKTELVNPRIQSFDPEELDYESFAPSTFRMQVIYETVIYGETKPLTSDQELYEVFSSPELAGSPLEIIDSPQPVSHWIDYSGQFVDVVQPTFANALVTLPGIISDLVSETKAGSGGVLSGRGEFDFGSAAIVAAQSLLGGRSTSNLAADVAYAGTKDVALTRLLAAGSRLTGVSTSVNQFDQTSSRVAGSVKNTGGSMAKSVVKGLLSNPQGSIKKGEKLLSLGKSVMGKINASRSATSQIGKRTPPK